MVTTGSPDTSLAPSPRRVITRWRAAAIHLGISACIGLIVMGLLFGLWYPPPYFHAAGADELVLLLLGVDVVLGPLLTLIVFRQGKRGMTFDLVVIGLAQACALIYGLSVVLHSRPIFLVAAIDRFELVAAHEIADADLAKAAKPEFGRRSWLGPVLVGAELPSDPQERSQLIFDSLDGRDIQNQPRYFRDYPMVAKGLAGKSRPLEQLTARSPEDTQAIKDWFDAHKGRSPDNTRWMPLVAMKADMIVLLDASSGDFLGVARIEPAW